MAAVRDAAGPFALQIQYASDRKAALSAARLARVDITGLGATVSPVVNAPGGPLLLVELPGRHDDRRQRVPDLVLDRLRELGLEAAVLAAVATGGQLDGLESVGNAVVLRAFPRPAGPGTSIPPAWLDLAGEWVAGDSSATATVRTRVLTVEHDVPVGGIHDVLHECLQARAWCDAVAGRLGDRIRTASLMFGRLPHLVVATGGDGADRATLLARFELLREAASALGPGVAYACVDFEPTFEGLAFGLSSDGWHRLGGAPPNDVAAHLVDERVPDAFPYQVVGPAHLERLSRAGVVVPLEPLDGGRAELAFGSPADWLRTSVGRDEVHAEALELLAPVLVTATEAAELVPERVPHSFAPVVAEETTDIDAVVLEPSPHAHRGTRLTVLELAAFLDHDHHTDRPTSVSPVIAAFVRWWAAGVDDTYRQGLRPLAAELPGTAGDPDAEQRRRWAVAQWLVREHAARWLYLAGLFDAADALRAIGSFDEHDHVVHAVDVLARAGVRANRRIDITASLASDAEEQQADRQAAWEAWEQVADAAGWSAASEAATEGIPAELADAANLCAMEAARAREPGDVAEVVWAATLQAVAAHAWDRGWRAADVVTRDLTGFTIRMEMGRVAKNSLRDLADDEQLEMAEAAATRSLTEAVLERPVRSEPHPWDDARRAAGLSAGGAVWALVVGEVEKMLGDTTWGQAMADARVAVEQELDRAPDNVARAVLVAVAREASGAAARAVALRASAVARANGADDPASAKAAVEALAGTADELRGLARSLVDSLLSDPRPPAPHH
jgi:hypothetical protein